MNTYKIRITANSHFDALVDGITQYAYCMENPDTNRHFHYILYTDKKPDTIRKRIKSHPDYQTGNAFYSMKVMKPEIEEGYPDYPYIRYEAYIAKDGIISFTGYTTEHIEKINEFLAHLKTEIKEKKKKTTNTTIIKEIEKEHFQDGWDVGYRSTQEKLEVITMKVIQYYKDHEKLVREFAMISQVQTLALKYVNSYDYALKNKILDKI